jgi:hypothetical protein
MGADGGVITTRQDMVQKQKRSASSEAERERHASLAQSHWTECTLTGLPLKSPILVSKNGSFFNKAPVLEAIASKTIPRNMRHLRQRDAMRELDLLGSQSLGAYRCPLSEKSPGPGTTDSWIVLFECGHLFHGPSFRELAMAECPVCGKAAGVIVDVGVNRS